MEQSLEYEIKGQARRLRAALKELNVSVSHSAALSLIARAHGHRHWEALAAGLTVQPDGGATQDTAQEWLEWLEASLRIQGLTEEDFDDLVHDILAPDPASQTNNDGLWSQLRALLDHFDKPDAFSADRSARADLVYALEQLHFPSLSLHLPESTKPRVAGIPARLSICAGSPYEESVVVDTLEWFARQDATRISALLRDGLRNSDASDEVGLWLERESLDPAVRKSLSSLLTTMRFVCERHEDVVGITVDIDRKAVCKYVEKLHAAGHDIAPALLEALS